MFEKKFDTNGNLSWYKVRLVAKGYSQIPGQDFNNTYSPVMQLDSLHILITLMAIKDLDSGQMDIKGAFLNPYLKEDIYMQQPKGYEDRTRKVCHLKHVLYGLQQSACEWNEDFNAYIISLGYKSIPSDPCVYIQQKEEEFDILSIWVDDCYFACTRGRLAQAKAEIATKYKATDQGEP